MRNETRAPLVSHHNVSQLSESHYEADQTRGTNYLRRCRLSPSPATGLVGLQENAFLNDYFGCLGFLPLATARWVTPYTPVP